jgi:hypothetical protein
MAVLYANNAVRHRVVDGLVVLLDLRGGDYVILNSVASAMWRALLCIGDHRERIIALEQEFDVPADRLEADLVEFIGKSVERGYLEQHETPAFRESRHPLGIHRKMLVLRAWQSLHSTTRALSRSGFARTYRDYSCFAKPSIDDISVDTLIARAEWAFSHAENFFLIHSVPNDCLPRSLALYRFLLSAGVPADHVIGVQRHPFRAHAWVVCQGRVLFDSHEFTSSFTELARI